jgi:hypothetical protein
MIWRSLTQVAFFLAAAILSACPAPTTSGQFQRYPTAAELELLTQRLKQEVDQMPERIKSAPIYSDQRTDAERKQMAQLTQTWAEVDPEIAPFLGKRQLIESQLIYPSRQRGQVCIIETYWLSETEHGVRFSTGRAARGMIRTTARQVLMRDRGYLGVAYIKNNRPELSTLPYPLPLAPPTAIDFLKHNPQVLQQFQQAQCLAT